ncbi:MAG: hypothetical protein LBQ74_00525 [Prevotella sp.]|jgi:hypothetical protein|nr:hypothetical protein [Prevotella sp.]
MKHVRGEDEGNLFNGIVYQATTDDGILQGNPIKSSRISKVFGYNALLRKTARTTQRVKEKKVNLKWSKGIISDAVQNCRSKSQFESMLKSNNIDVVFRENEQKRIYGVTFIDHNNKTVYNGSRLGKDFSANIFNNLFNNTAVSFKEHSTSVSLENPHHPDSGNTHTPVSVDEIFGTFYLDNSPYDVEEDNFKRLLKRRKKKKY